MSLILSLSLVIVFILCYMLMIEIFSILFRLTGLSKEKARFQVISLLTNSGFTTNESELITNDRSRRKIAKFAMIFGTIFNVVIASLFINILITITNEDKIESLKIFGITIGCFVLLLLILRIPFVRRFFERIIEKLITRIEKKRLKKNIITVMDSYGRKSIVEVYVSTLPKELEDKSIENSPLRSKYNINILTIQRQGKTIAVKKDTMLQKGDRIVMFGKPSNIKELFANGDNEIVEETKEIRENRISIIENYGSNAMAEVNIHVLPEILKNKTLSESKLKETYDITILMIQSSDKAILVNANTKINVGDKIILIGPYEHIKEVF